jgi:hypothetical protein
MAHILVMKPTSFEVRPSDLSRMLWQCIRKQWLRPSLMSNSSALRPSIVNCGVFYL